MITDDQFFDFYCLTVQHYSANDMIEEMMGKGVQYREEEDYQAGSLRINLLAEPAGKLPQYVPRALVTYEANGLAMSWIVAFRNDAPGGFSGLTAKYLHLEVKVEGCIDIEGFLSLQAPRHELEKN